MKTLKSSHGNIQYSSYYFQRACEMGFQEYNANPTSAFASFKFFFVVINSMQDWPATARHRVLRKQT